MNTEEFIKNHTISEERASFFGTIIGAYLAGFGIGGVEKASGFPYYPTPRITNNTIPIIDNCFMQGYRQGYEVFRVRMNQNISKYIS